MLALCICALVHSSIVCFRVIGTAMFAILAPCFPNLNIVIQNHVQMLTCANLTLAFSLSWTPSSLRLSACSLLTILYVLILSYVSQPFFDLL
jgi:hypothetical protein